MDILTRKIPPVPGESCNKIPWNDPDFSQRMLEIHLCQDHDWASRRYSIIDRQIEWISRQLPNQKARILDLGCGPGLYTHRLARLGYDCVGVDFSPASIAYANQQAMKDNLPIEYLLADVRHCDIEGSFDLVMMVFGEFNVFSEKDAFCLLTKATSLLKENGLLIAEVHTFEEIQRQGQTPPSWQTMENGLFSDRPHIWLEEHFWDESRATTRIRYWIVDAKTSHVWEYGSTLKAYTDQQYRLMFEKNGLREVRILTADEWPVGDICEGKLQVYACQTVHNSVSKTS